MGFVILLGLARLLCNLLAVCHTPGPPETLLAKVLAVGQKKSLEAAFQQIQDFGIEPPPPPPPPPQVKGLQSYTAPPKLDACSRVSKAHTLDEIHKSGWPRWWKKELEMVQIRICDQDLLDNPNGKELPPE